MREKLRRGLSHGEADQMKSPDSITTNSLCTHFQRVGEGIVQVAEAEARNCPWCEIERLQRELTSAMGRLDFYRVKWEERQAHEPLACNHGAISPKGTMFYHGFVGAANHWRCDACKGVFEGNLTEANTVGSQALTLVSPTPPPYESKELHDAADDLLDWIDRTRGDLFRTPTVRKRGRVDRDASSSNEEHNDQVRTAIERLRTALTARDSNG
jgi:hypothetical protein